MSLEDALAARDAALAAGPPDDGPADPFQDIDECPDGCGGSFDSYNHDCNQCGLTLADRGALDAFLALPYRYEATYADLAGTEQTFSRHRTLAAARASAVAERDRGPKPGRRRATEAWMVRDTDDYEAGDLLEPRPEET